MSDLAFAGIGELAPRLRSRDLSPVELVRALFERIARLDPKLHAYEQATQWHTRLPPDA